MLVLPVWTQVESKKLASHLCVQFEAVVIYNKLTFVISSPPPNSWWENNNHQKIEVRTCDLYESHQNMGERGWHAVLLKIRLVTRSDQPPCVWLEQIN